MPTFVEQLTSRPPSVEALEETLHNLDACFLNGFVGIQNDTLSSLPRLFAGTPLHSHLTNSIDAILQNAFMEAHFVALAAARSALQGTLYDVLDSHVKTALGRAVEPVGAWHAMPSPNSDPLLDSVRHWLMEVAITGFARLEDEAVQSFSSTLSQVRANPATAAQGALLTGFWHEILESMPIKDAADVPLTRWCDLWSLIMLKSVGISEMPQPGPVSGTLYPLSLELKSHARAASLVVYSLLTNDSGAQFVRTTWNSFKVAAIQGDEIWLLFPEAQPLVDSLAQGKFMTLEDMPMLPSGDLLWSADAARVGKKFKWREIGEQYFGLDKGMTRHAPTSALERHPVHIAEPVYLTDYRVEEESLRWETEASLQLDPVRPSVPPEVVTETVAMFGMLHYDDGQWSVQPLATESKMGVFTYVGESGAAILKKPPKTNTVSILRERASRLLRKKRSVTQPESETPTV